MKRRTVAGLVVLGVVAYLIMLIATLPVARVLAWTDPSSLTVHGASGRIWAGAADRVDIHDPAGVPAVTEVRWDVIVPRLLLGQLHADVEAAAAGLQAQGRVGITPARQLLMRDLTLRGPVAGLVQQAPLPIAAGGILLARIESARIEDGVPREIRGRAVWSDAMLAAPVPMALGRVVIDFEPTEGAQRAMFKAEDGELLVDGTARLDPAGQYQLDLRLTPAPGASRQLHELLRLFARPGGDGSYRIRRNGSLR